MNKVVNCKTVLHLWSVLYPAAAPSRSVMTLKRLYSYGVSHETYWQHVVDCSNDNIFFRWNFPATCISRFWAFMIKLTCILHIPAQFLPHGIYILYLSFSWRGRRISALWTPDLVRGGHACCHCSAGSGSWTRGPGRTPWGREGGTLISSHTQINFPQLSQCDNSSKCGNMHAECSA